MNIRHAEIDDLDALEHLENATFSYNRLSRRSLRYYVTGKTATVLVAMQGGKLVAYGLVSFRKNSPIARLYSLAVAHAASGLGLGRRLLAECEQTAIARGARAMQLEVREDNAAAIRLYQAMGYREYERVEEFYEDDSTAICFEKDLP
ncbi:MAG: GNAT family N-acetyltransferase [Hyphomicrobiales bacterium]|nr:GNAT family N-acetyltransferase [Hyphomicrobiales bacterium]MDE2113895.1 GNAT family N-acetyltransferase [Hyphomicrobiales bacterium]